jgi:hypothetical protein
MKKLLITAFFIFFAGASFSQMKAFKENSNGWRPADLKLEEGVLLIEKVSWPKKQQKKIEEFMEKKYPYKYEFVDAKDLNDSTKFSDKNTYKFALMCTYSSKTMHENQPNQRPLNVGTFDFNFIDRLNNKAYPKSGIFSSWASMTFKQIIETLLEK